MNYKILSKLLSIITTSLALAFAMSLGVGLLYQRAGYDEQASNYGLAISIGVAAVLAGLLYFLGRGADNKMFRKEGLAVIGLGWLLASVVGALPYLLIMPDCSFADGFFESASGFTTTGASVFSDLESMPRGLMFWRCTSQWIGGLGVVVFIVAVLSYLGAGGKILFSSESSANSTDLGSARVQTGVIQFMVLYLAITAASGLTYKLCGLDWYDSVCHAFTTVSTAGFSTRSASVAAFQNPAFEWAVVFYMAVVGTSFLLMLRIMGRDWDLARRNTELKLYYGILGGATLVTALLIAGEGSSSIEGLLRVSAFQTVSVMTTTGFATEDFDLWPPAVHTLFLALMVLGGSSGSTAGGVKVVRLAVALRVCLLNIERSFRTHVVRSVKINGKVIDVEAREGVVTYLVLMGLVTLGSTVLVSLLEPDTSFKGILSAVEATLFNIGPGFNEVGPTKNFAFFHSHTKIFLSLLMIMGRLELYAILVLFAPSLWRKFQ